MAWEDLEEDERELLEESSYSVRKSYYSAAGWSLILSVAVVCVTLALFVVMLLVFNHVVSSHG